MEISIPSSGRGVEGIMFVIEPPCQRIRAKQSRIIFGLGMAAYISAVIYMFCYEATPPFGSNLALNEPHVPGNCLCDGLFALRSH